MYKVWDRGKPLLSVSELSKYTPILNNPSLAEFYKLHGFVGWSQRGISTMDHVQKDGLLKSFVTLKLGLFALYVLLPIFTI